ncbi:MAG: hypothetical protein JW955_12890 [Sedimentisphaerales bacterium]|nr:hypothetical protein [Sedimentisphaerales bacterium]
MKPERRWMQGVGVLSGLLLVWVAGCQQNGDPDMRQARLAAAENIELKKDLARCEARIESLKKEYDQQLARKDAQLAASRKLSEDLKKDLEKGIAERVKAVTASVMEENAKLRREIEELRAKIGELDERTELRVRPLGGL